MRHADEMGERYSYREIKYRSGKVLQPRRGSGDNWNLRLTFAYLNLLMIFLLI